MTTIINVFGGPGIGKSTVAAQVYSLMKRSGVSVELVREYVKDWAWQGRKIGQFDQFYILGKQIHAESVLYGKVDYIITDSPVLLNFCYAEKYSAPAMLRGVKAAIDAFYEQCEAEGHKHVHLLLKRSHAYVQDGRYENEEALEIDKSAQVLLHAMGFEYTIVANDERSVTGACMSIVTS